jgi:hypothetical protein
MTNMIKDVKVTRIMNGVAAGTTDQTSSRLDMQGFEGVTFIISFGALTATQVTSAKVQQNTIDSGTGMADLAGTSIGPLADGDSNKEMIIDIWQPQERWLQVIIDRGTANAVIDGITAIQYNAHKSPTTQPSTAAFVESHQSPSEGTA